MPCLTLISMSKGHEYAGLTVNAAYTVVIGDSQFAGKPTICSHTFLKGKPASKNSEYLVKKGRRAHSELHGQKRYGRQS
jgi:hypothetical protein